MWGTAPGSLWVGDSGVLALGVRPRGTTVQAAERREGLRPGWAVPRAQAPGHAGANRPLGFVTRMNQGSHAVRGASRNQGASAPEQPAPGLADRMSRPGTAGAFPSACAAALLTAPVQVGSSGRLDLTVFWNIPC